MANVLRDLANQAEYGGQEAKLAQCGSPGSLAMARPATISENFEARKEKLQQQLARVEAALAAVKANPNVEELINLLSQV